MGNSCCNQWLGHLWKSPWSAWWRITASRSFQYVAMAKPILGGIPVYPIIKPSWEWCNLGFISLYGFIDGLSHYLISNVCGIHLLIQHSCGYTATMALSGNRWSHRVTISARCSHQKLLLNDASWLLAIGWSNPIAVRYIQHNSEVADFSRPTQTA